MAKIIMDENETVNEAVEVENTEAPELDADFSVDADSVENTSTDTEPPTDGSGIDTDMSVETPEETTPTDKEESSDNTQTEGNPDENIDNSVDDGISSLPLEDTDLKPVYDEPTGQADSVGTGKKWTDGYTIKKKPSDDDEAMILSASEKANKRIKFSGIWDWIVDKMANAVVSKLTTTDKTVLGAINELNSNSSRIYRKDYVSNLTELVNDSSLLDICIFHLNGANYSGGDLPKGNYNYGSGIIFNRGSSSCKIVLFSEIEKPIWKLSSWQKWRDFTNAIID